MRRCAFCSAQSTKLSAEHVWGDWMSELFHPAGRNQRTTQEHQHEGKLKRWKSFRSLTANVVCKKCNETWMSGIEARIKTSFSQVIRDGCSMSILFQGVCLLAQFAFEKAVIADHLHLKDEDPFFKSVDRDRFRESFVIPDGVQMWLAAFRGRGVYRLYSKRHLTFDLQTRSNLEELSFAYVAGHLVI